jgi:hypothetical protein
MRNRKAEKPPARPRISAEAVEDIVQRHKVEQPVVLVGIRGYYAKTFSDPKKGQTAGNDRGIYDDAIMLLSPTAFATFNANVDPSIFRHGIATLEEGVHPYRKGNHGISRGDGYPALRPATEGERLPVRRDGQSGPKVGVAINIHRGGLNTTSSEGCQTIHPEQWPAFIAMVYGEMDRHGQQVVPYILTRQSS